MLINDTAPDLAGWKHIYSGKVRDLYRPESGENVLLVVASNRVSAFDEVLDPPIPGKGALLTALSKWWFDRLDVPNHLTDSKTAVPETVADRAIVAKELEMFPVECVVRGALTGSGFKEYEQSGKVCGVKLPAGISDGDLLEEPIYTPAYKAPLGEHDENITFEQTEELVGTENAAKLREISLQIFKFASALAADHGVILADTKFEFGIDKATGEITLADEVLTSDSSRYWDAKIYAQSEGPARMSSFDKQIVRDWLRQNWDGKGTPPKLPDDIVSRTREKYQELLDIFNAPA